MVNQINFKEIDLRVGLEIHQQLNTKAKLFCNCPTELTEKVLKEKVLRKLRATKSEVGEVDPAALFEYLRGKSYLYKVPPETSCLVELDEEPPSPLNKEALLVALAVAKALNMILVDEVHVMRKIVIDGSNTTGFQRTALLALNGFLRDEEGIIRIQTLCLEEDAARKASMEEATVVYNLDRLGIPLIEIATGPDIRTPEQAKRVAFKIGLLVRLTGKAKRGIGTIRQDLNVSVKGGRKIEIKGVQKLELIPKVIEYEALRQINLLKLKDELFKRGLKPENIKFDVKDVTEALKKTKCKFIASALKRGEKVYAILLPGFKGLIGMELQPRRRFGTELADYAKQWGGVKGIMHSDELPAYGISKSEVNEIFKLLKGNPVKDAFIFVVASKDKAFKALKAVYERVINAFKGVPAETRAANPDGTTHYMRPQPGAARMYPETDIPPIRITNELIKEAERYLSPSIEKLEEELKVKYSLSKDIIMQLIKENKLDFFIDLIKSYGNKVSPTYIASLLIGIIKSLKSEGVNVENITEDHIEAVIKALANKLIAKEAIPEVLKEISKYPDKEINKIIEKYKQITELPKIEEFIAKIIEKNINKVKEKGERASKYIMGLVMKELRGKVDGKIVYDIVSKLIKKYVKVD